MSSEDAQNFVNRIFREESLRNELNERIEVQSSSGDTEPSELKEIMGEIVPEYAAEYGYDFTSQEGFDALEELQETMQVDEELSEAELEQVAGGKSQEGKLMIGISVVSLGAGCGIVSIYEGDSGSDEMNCADAFK